MNFRMMSLSTELNTFVKELIALADPELGALGTLHEVLGVDIKGLVVLARQTLSVEALYGFKQPMRCRALSGGRQ